MANKGVIGNHYRVEKDSTTARFECNYTCPYCHQENNKSFSVDIQRCEEALDEGIFYEVFECSYCGGEADVRFHV